MQRPERAYTMEFDFAVAPKQLGIPLAGGVGRRAHMWRQCNNLRAGSRATLMEARGPHPVRVKYLTSSPLPAVQCATTRRKTESTWFGQARPCVPARTHESFMHSASYGEDAVIISMEDRISFFLFGKDRHLHWWNRLSTNIFSI